MVKKMDDLISRQAVLEGLNKLYIKEPITSPDYGWNAAIDHITIMVEDKPSAEPERKKGVWEVWDILDYAQRPTGRKILRCPFCGHLTGDFRGMVDYNLERTNYCPNCGAPMEEGGR